MPVKHAILGILKEAPRHGYELKSIFDERIGNFWNLNYGQIYTTLDRLEKEDFVSGAEEEQDSRPDKKVYNISPKGIQELERWLQEPATKPRPLRDELFIKLLFISRENPELCKVANGEYDLFISSNGHEWDVAAARIFLVQRGVGLLIRRKEDNITRCGKLLVAASRSPVIWKETMEYLPQPLREKFA